MMLDDFQEELENDVYKWLNRSIARLLSESLG